MLVRPRIAFACLLLLLVLSSKAFSASEILVEMPSGSGHFIPLDFTVVNDLKPTIKLETSPQDASITEVLLKDQKGQERDITNLFTKGLGKVEVKPGENTIIIKTTDRTISARMLNFDHTVLSIVPSLNAEIKPIQESNGIFSLPNQLLIAFLPNLDETRISQFLMDYRLRPVGVVQSQTARTFFLDTTENRFSEDVFALRDRFRKTEIVLAVATHFLVPPFTVVAEKLPARLINAAAPNVPAVEQYNVGTAGFDNNGTSCPSGGPPPTCDEVDLFWHHFFMDTAAALRLRDQVMGASGRSVLAVVDSGFGDDPQSTNGDVNAFFNFSHEAGTTTARGIDLSSATVLVSTDPTFRDPVNGNGALRVNQNGVPGTIADGVEDSSGHGTTVAIDSLGNGNRKLGLGPDVSLLPIRDGSLRTTPPLTPIGQMMISLQAAALIPEVDVINLSSGFPNLPANAADFCAKQILMAPWLQYVAQNNKILVVASGNQTRDTDDVIFSVFAARRGHRKDNAVTNNCFPSGFAPSGLHNLIVSVSATDIMNAWNGPETAAGFSNIGDRISVSAAGGENNIGVSASGIFIAASGTSFSAPKVAGLLAELAQVRDGIGGHRPNDQHPDQGGQMRLVETIEATADDLVNDGRTIPGPNVLYPIGPATFFSFPTTFAPHNRHHHDQGNPRLPDNRFGYGRINAWKAMLSVANEGIATEGRQDANNDGFDDTFSSLKLIKEPMRIKWYGFRIRTSIKGATVWIDGTKLQDSRAPTPDTQAAGTTPDIKAYRGVHNAIVLTAPPAPLVIAMDPGITGVGNPGGEYIITFSAERSDLVQLVSDWKTLVLRKPGATVDDPPLFALKLDLAKMQGNQVAGVFYDDFVFEINAPDFGDTPDNPAVDGFKTTKAAQGGFHQNQNLEWLGPFEPGNNPPVNIEHVSPETDAVDPTNRPDADGINNLGYLSGHNDLDRFDDGVMFYPTTYKPGGNAITDFTVCVADPVSPRYLAAHLYLNAWFDWNTNKKWEEVNSEHLIDGLEIEPKLAPWTVTNPQVTLLTMFAGNHCAKFRAAIPLPAALNIGREELRVRFRLDYAENAGRVIPTHLFAANAGIKLAAGELVFGEVEDYIIGSDFGDAQDPFLGLAAGNYPTKGAVGAAHMDFTREWFGDPGTKADASRETSACDLTKAEEDGNANLVRQTCINRDNDLHDTGITIPQQIEPGKNFQIELKISARSDEFGFSNRGAGGATPPDSNGIQTLKPACVMGPIADAADTPIHHRDRGRYAAWDDLRRLYIKGWIDWNGNGQWEANEVVIEGPVDPEDWGGDNHYTLGEPFVDTNKDGIWNPGEQWTDILGKTMTKITCTRMAPATVPDNFQSRFRINYGEKDWVNNDNVAHHATEIGRALNQEKSAALWGEVEDYPHYNRKTRKRPPRESPD